MSGPVMIVARHYHHLLDGCALLSTIDRPAHPVVGLDWTKGGMLSHVMNRLCRMARWPVVMRASGDEVGRVRVFRHALRETTALLQEGRVVIVFPEGYPNIDPHFTPKQGDEFLPFQPGFLRFVRVAEKSGVGTVSIVPAGLHYRRLDGKSGQAEWALHLAFGAPITLASFANDKDALAAIETAVIRLSGM